MPKTRRLSDASLVRRSQQGDRRAFSALVGRHDWRLRGLAYALLLDRGEMDAALAAAYLRSWRDVVRVNAKDDDIVAWLYRTAYNACVDRLRLGASRRDPEAAPGGSGPIVAAGLAGLPPTDRVALVLVDREGFPPEAAARIMDQPVAAVQRRLESARARLAADVGPILAEARAREEAAAAEAAAAEAAAEEAAAAEAAEEAAAEAAAAEPAVVVDEPAEPAAAEEAAAEAAAAEPAVVVDGPGEAGIEPTAAESTAPAPGVAESGGDGATAAPGADVASGPAAGDRDGGERAQDGGGAARGPAGGQNGSDAAGDGGSDPGGDAAAVEAAGNGHEANRGQGNRRPARRWPRKAVSHADGPGTAGNDGS